MAAGIAASPLSSATADRNNAQGTALGQPGVLTMSQSTASDSDAGQTAEWSAVSVAGTSVIGKDMGGDWSGAASALGPAVDSVNTLLCPGYTEVQPGTSIYACANLLGGDAFAEGYYGSGAYGAIAGSLIYVQNGDDYYGASSMLLPSDAFASHDCRSGRQANGSLAFLGTQAGADSTYTEDSYGLEHAEHGNECAR